VDTLCGIGLPEMIILALLGFVVIGPERSQDLALRTGRFLRTVMRSAWWREFNQMAGALRDLPNTLVRMAELEEAQAELKRSMQEIEQEVNVDFGRGNQQGAITDPWGIQNATAETRIIKPPVANQASEPEKPSPKPPDSSIDEAEDV